MTLPHWLGYVEDDYDGVRTWRIGHSTIGLRSPITVDTQQLLIATGIRCPRHRAIWKRRLGWFGRWIPDLEWDDRGERLRNVWRRKR